MNIENLLNNNPLSKEIIRQWFFKKLTESINDDIEVPQDFRDAMISEGISDKLLKMHIEYNPHCLFEIFDNNELFINVFKNKKEVGYRINEFIGNTLLFNSRIEAEKEAIEDCLILLEAKLKTNISNG